MNQITWVLASPRQSNVELGGVDATRNPRCSIRNNVLDIAKGPNTSLLRDQFID
jgi:hypothetical protein